MGRRDQLAQEGTKARLHVLLDVAVMVCVILSDPGLPHSPTPLSTLVVTSFLTVLDMVRLDTMLRLHVAKWLCFLLLEADLLWRLPERSLGRAGMDVLSALLFGTLLPFVFAAGSEVRCSRLLPLFLGAGYWVVGVSPSLISAAGRGWSLGAGAVR